jgi:HEAT repeat protein
VETLRQIDAPGAADLLCAAAADEDSGVRLAAGSAMAKRGDGRATEALAPLLEAEEAAVRREAVQALATADDQRVPDLLAAMLYDENADVRTEAIRALANVGGPEVADHLAAVLDHGSSDQRLAAVRALAAVAGESATTRLVAALMDQDRRVRRVAAEELEKLGWSPEGDAEGASYWAVKGWWSRCLDAGAEAVEPLMLALGALQPEERGDAVAALGLIGDDRAVRPLVATLRDIRAARIDLARRRVGDDAYGEAYLSDDSPGKSYFRSWSEETDKQNEKIDARIEALKKVNETAVGALEELTGKDLGDDLDGWAALVEQGG